jgi:hypothetical protein
LFHISSATSHTQLGMRMHTTFYMTIHTVVLLVLYSLFK